MSDTRGLSASQSSNSSTSTSTATAATSVSPAASTPPSAALVLSVTGSPTAANKQVQADVINQDPNHIEFEQGELHHARGIALETQGQMQRNAGDEVQAGVYFHQANQEFLQARHHYEMAGFHGAALCALGGYYLVGLGGLPKDRTKSVKCFANAKRAFEYAHECYEFSEKKIPYYNELVRCNHPNKTSTKHIIVEHLEMASFTGHPDATILLSERLDFSSAEQVKAVVESIEQRAAKLENDAKIFNQLADKLFFHLQSNPDDSDGVRVALMGRLNQASKVSRDGAVKYYNYLAKLHQLPNALLKSDEAKAMSFFRRAADQGDSKAVLWFYGYYKEHKQPEQARQCFDQAACMGNLWGRIGSAGYYFEKDEKRLVRERGIARTQLETASRWLQTYENDPRVNHEIIDMKEIVQDYSTRLNNSENHDLLKAQAAANAAALEEDSGPLLSTLFGEDVDTEDNNVSHGAAAAANAATTGVASTAVSATLFSSSSAGPATRAAAAAAPAETAATAGMRRTTPDPH